MILLLTAAFANDVHYACDGFNKAIDQGAAPGTELQTAALHATQAGAPPAAMGRWADMAVLLKEAKAGDPERCKALVEHLEARVPAPPAPSPALPARPEGVEGCEALKVCCVSIPDAESQAACESIVESAAMLGDEGFCVTSLEAYATVCWSP